MRILNDGNYFKWWLRKKYMWPNYLRYSKMQINLVWEMWMANDYENRIESVAKKTHPHPSHPKQIFVDTPRQAWKGTEQTFFFGGVEYPEPLK